MIGTQSVQCEKLVDLNFLKGKNGVGSNGKGEELVPNPIPMGKTIPDKNNIPYDQNPIIISKTGVGLLDTMVSIDGIEEEEYFSTDGTPLPIFLSPPFPTPSYQDTLIKEPLQSFSGLFGSGAPIPILPLE